METRADFLIKDNLCVKAIEEFKMFSDALSWLEQYSELYNWVTIKPEGLPRLTSSYFNGECFENIQKFAKIYAAVLESFE